MTETKKRWFEVTASVEFPLKVFARNRDEAVNLFWERDEDIDSILMYPDNLQIMSVDECEPDAEGEQVASWNRY
jgi:hypothetical protein